MPFPDYTPNFNSVGALQKQPQDLNFLSRCKFKFTIRKLPNVNFFVQSVNLASVGIQSTEQPTPLQNLPVAGTTLNYGPLEVTFVVDEQFLNYIELWTWIQGLGFPKNFNEYVELRDENTDINSEFGGIYSDASLFILTQDYKPIINFIYIDAYPDFLSEIQFDTTLEDPGVATCTARFKYAWTEIKKVK